MKGLNSSQLKFTRLVTTSNKTGTVPADQIMQRSFMGPPQMNPDLPMLEKPTGDTYIVAAQIRGKVPVEETPLAVENIPMSDQEANVDQADASAESSPEADANEVADAPKTDAAKSDAAKSDDAPSDDAPAKPQEPEINVVLVSDIDCLFGEFFRLRSRGTDPADEIDFQFDNVPFVLNVLDVLAGDDRFVEIRTRRPLHRSLSKLQQVTEGARDAAHKAREKYQTDFENARIKAQADFDAKIQSLQNREGVDQRQAAMDVLTAQRQGQRALEVKLETLKDERDRKLKSAQRDLDQRVHRAGLVQAVGCAAAPHSAADRGLHRLLQSSRRRARRGFPGSSALAAR